MNTLSHLVKTSSAIIMAFVGTAIILGGGVIYAMGQTHAGPGQKARTEVLGGAVYFAVEPTSRGTSNVSMGIHSFPVVSIIFVLLLLASALIVYLIPQRKKRKTNEHLQ